jgi:hypothetical protein
MDQKNGVTPEHHGTTTTVLPPGCGSINKIKQGLDGLDVPYNTGFI